MQASAGQRVADARQQLAEAKLSVQKRQAMAALAAVASHYVGTPASFEAMERMAQYDRRLGLQPVEPTLEVLSRNAKPAVAAHAGVALAVLYEQRGWPKQAAHQWQALTDRLPETSVTWEGRQAVIADLAAEQLAALPIRSREDDLLATGKTPLPPWETAWQARGYGNGVIDVHELDQSEFLSNHLLVVLRSERVIRALPTDAASVDDSRKAWDIPIPRDILNTFQNSRRGLMFSGSLSGDLLVFRTDDTIEGWSLITGKKLWEEKTGNTSYLSSRQWARQQHEAQQSGVGPMAIGDGVLVRHLVNDDMTDQVVVRDAATGDLLWERAVDGQMVTGVAAHNGRVALVLEDRLVLCDPRTGRVTATIDLPRERNNDQLLWAGDLLIFSNNQVNAIEARRLSDGGLHWRSEGHYRFGRIDEDHVYNQSSHSSEIHVLDVHTGKIKVRIDARKERIQTHNMDIAFADEGRELFVVGHDNRGKARLWIFDVRNGKVAKEIEFERQYGAQVPAEVLANAGELLPWIVRSRDDNGNYTGRTRIGFYRKSTGELYTKHELPNFSKRSRYYYVHRPPQIRDDLLIVTTNDGVAAYRTKGEPVNLASASGGGGEHTVEEGDTLFAIARQYYGDGHQWPKIAEANPDVSPEKLQVGMKLKIPAIDEPGAGDVKEIRVKPDQDVAEVIREIEALRKKNVKVRIIQEEQ
jgi:outer membrane protein assembly factor BamB